MDSTLGDDSPSYDTVKYWHHQYKCGHASTATQPSSGRPQELDIQQLASVIEDHVRENPRISQRQLAALVNHPKSTVQRVLTDHLQMRKLCTRWMPKLLSAPQHHDRIQCSSENLVLYKQSPTKFLASIVTGDESWVHHFDPLSQQEAKEWTKKGESSGARPRQQQSAGKVLLSVFWDEKGVLLTDYLEKGHTVTGLYYVNLIEKLREAIKNKRRGKLSSGVHLLHDNAPSHTSHVAVTAIHAAGFKTLNHPPYSPDLAPSDYHLFSHLKRYLRGKVFKTDAEVISSVESYFESQPVSFYSGAISALPERWQRAIDMHGSYIE